MSLVPIGGLLKLPVSEPALSLLPRAGLAATSLQYSGPWPQDVLGASPSRGIFLRWSLRACLHREALAKHAWPRV